VKRLFQGLSGNNARFFFQFFAVFGQMNQICAAVSLVRDTDNKVLGMQSRQMPTSYLKWNF
jgi:hypothetical protein